MFFDPVGSIVFCLGTQLPWLLGPPTGRYPSAGEQLNYFSIPVLAGPTQPSPSLDCRQATLRCNAYRQHAPAWYARGPEAFLFLRVHFAFRRQLDFDR